MLGLGRMTHVDRSRGPLTTAILILVASASFWLHPVLVANAAASDTTYVSEGPFSLTKGAGVPVCDAYLKRLNLDTSATPPFCDRPEDDRVPGFKILNRVSLSVAQAMTLGQQIHNFTMHGNQDQSNRGRKFITRTTLKLELGHDIRAWRYEPRVDIDNDGQPDDVVVWHGYGASTGLYRCKTGPGDLRWRQTQIAYVVTPDLARIDEAKTREIFGFPRGAYPIIQNGKTTGFTKAFRPIGRTIGIFEYDSHYYFDTFFDSYGDFQGKRQNAPDIANTLGVFLRRGGVTKQICEYRWGGNP